MAEPEFTHQGFNLNDPETRKKALIVAGAVGAGIGLLILVVRGRDEQPVGDIPVVQTEGQVTEGGASEGSDDWMTELGSNLDQLSQNLYAYVDEQNQATQQALQDLAQQMADALGGVWDYIAQAGMTYDDAGYPGYYDAEGVGHGGPVEEEKKTPTGINLTEAFERFAEKAGGLFGQAFGRAWEQYQKTYGAGSEPLSPRKSTAPFLQRKRAATQVEMERSKSALRAFREVEAPSAPPVKGGGLFARLASAIRHIAPPPAPRAGRAIVPVPRQPTRPVVGVPGAPGVLFQAGSPVPSSKSISTKSRGVESSSGLRIPTKKSGIELRAGATGGIKPKVGGFVQP